MAASTLEVIIVGDASQLTAALNQATAGTKQFEQTAGSAAQGAKGAFSSIGQSLKTLAPAFIAVGAATVGAVTKGIAATQQWASDTRTLQRVTGQTAEGASTLLASAQLLGIGVDKLSVGFGTLSKNIVNASPNLTKYGIEVKDASGAMLPFNDILGAISDEFLKLPAGPQQAAFAMNVFGRSGKDLIPILAKGREGMAQLADKASELGLVMGQDDLDASKALTAAQRELGLALKGAAISLGQLFIPALTKVVQVATKAIEFFTRLPDPIKEIGVGLGIAAGAVGVLTVAFNGLSSTFGPVIGGLTSFGKALLETGLFQNAASALQGVSGAVELVGAEVQKQSQNIQSASDTASSALGEVGAASTLAANAVTVSATRTAKAAAGVGGVVEKEAGAISGFFSRLVAGAAGIGEALSGIGSSIAGALTSPVGIIIGIVAALTALTVIVVKNWDTIKGWARDVGRAFGPALDKVGSALDGVRKSFAEVGHALGAFMSATKDAFAALGDAFGEVATAAQPLLPLLAPLGRILAALAVAPIVAMLKATAIALHLLAVGFETSARAVENFAGFVQKLAVIIGPVLNLAINTVIDGLNILIAGWNKLLPVINLITQAGFQHIDALDHVAMSSTDAAGATDAFGSSAASATSDVKSLADAADGAAGGFRNLGPALQRAAPLLAAMGTSVTDFKDAALSAAQTTKDAIANAATEGADAWDKFKTQAIADAIAARSAFQDQARSALTFTTSMLADLESAAEEASKTLAGDTSSLDHSQLAALRDQANITATDILHTFQAATSQTKQFGADLLELARIGGQAGKDLAASLLESGNVLAAQTIADAPKKLQERIVGAFGASEDAANSFATKLTDAIVGPLSDIRKILKLIAEKAFNIDVNLNDHGSKKRLDAQHEELKRMTGTDWITHLDLDNRPAETAMSHTQERLKIMAATKWETQISANTTQARNAITGLRYQLSNISARNYNVNVIVHTKGGSPMPDEALRMHLFDPIKQAGFKRIGDRWTLPLDVAVHTSANNALGNVHAGLGRKPGDKPKPWGTDWWFDFAMQDVPRLPRTHGLDIDPLPRGGRGARQRRDLNVNVNISRERMDREGAYQETYSGFS